MINRNRNKQENKIGCGNFISSHILNLLVISKLTVPGFTHLVVQHKTVKDMVYTSRCGSQTITVKVIHTLEDHLN